MKNTFEYRYFLLCNEIANKMMNHQYQNFAELIVGEENGRIMNSQMTFYFYQIDSVLSNLLSNDEGFMWDLLDIDEVADLTPEQLQEDYKKYCIEGEALTFKF